jgi:hypothetical protein
MGVSYDQWWWGYATLRKRHLVQGYCRPEIVTGRWVFSTPF